MDSPKKPADSAPEVKMARSAQATGTEANTRPSPGTVYEGQVKARQADGTYTVTIDDPKVELDGVQLAFPVLGGFLGLQVRCNLPQYTKVKIAYGNPSFIFAVIPENNADWLNAKNRSLIWGEDMDEAQGVTESNFLSHAEDLLEGEVEFSNLFGVSLDFLTTLMRMRAGDRAAVECHLINDMVRVISSQFRHISGLGDELMFDHGRPTRERTWASYRHEVLGSLAEKEEYAPLDGDEVDREAMEADRVLRIGRHRFREFMGFAGDFIHSFVSDPPETMAKLAKGQADAGGGKSWIHRNNDGSVLVQSTADIRWERVTRIPVAVRCASHEDPQVTTAREYDSLDSQYLKLPSMVSPPDEKDAFQMAYHIRSYARWLGRYHAFARMLQLDQEYEIPSETESPEPEWNNREEDREDANPQVKYYDAYACISILRDGSIVNHDGYGSSIVMSNGNVQVSAARHLDLEAAGDIRMVAGGSIHAKARRNIEFSAYMGGIIIHGYAWLKMLCERGTAWIRSNAQTGPNATAPQPKEAGGPDPEIAGGHEEGWAVLVEASEGAAAYRSEKGATLAVDGSPEDDDDDSCNINVVSKADVDLFGQREAILHSRENVKIGSGNNVAIATQALLTNATEFLVGPNLDKPFLVMRFGKLYCQRMETVNFKANSIQGPPRPGAVPSPDPNPNLHNPKQHFNHIDEYIDKVEDPDPAEDDQKELMTETAAEASQRPDLGWNNSGDGPLWEFAEKDEYVWDSREKVNSAIPETLTQQYLRVDNPADPWDGNGWKDWKLRGTIEGARTNSIPGFGAYEQQMKASDQGENLHEPSGTAPSGMTLPQAEWSSQALKIKALKRDDE